MLGDDHLGAACIEIGDQGIAVERRVADQRPKGEPVDERRHAHRVEALPRQKHEAHKGAERVGERQDRGGQAAFGTANGLTRSPPLYEVPCVKRYLLRANAVCWTKSGTASRLSGRRLAAPPWIRSALTGDLTTIPRAWAMRGRESGTYLCSGTLALGGHRSTLVPLRREQPAAAAANSVSSSARRLPAQSRPSHSATTRQSACA